MKRHLFGNFSVYTCVYKSVIKVFIQFNGARPLRHYAVNLERPDIYFFVNCVVFKSFTVSWRDKYRVGPRCIVSIDTNEQFISIMCIYHCYRYSDKSERRQVLSAKNVPLQNIQRIFVENVQPTDPFAKTQLQ